MISIEEAKTYYPRDRCPPDEELQKVIKLFYWIAEGEHAMLQEKE